MKVECGGHDFIELSLVEVAVVGKDQGSGDQSKIVYLMIHPSRDQSTVTHKTYQQKLLIVLFVKMISHPMMTRVYWT